MSQSTRRVSRAAAVVRRAATGLVLVFAATCVRDQTTAPVLRAPPSVAVHGTYTTLGTYSIPIPGDNLNGAGVPPANTGIFVPAGTYYRVRVNGTVTTTLNPAYLALGGTAGFASWTGTWGPGGTGNAAELQVLLKYRMTSSGAVGPIPFLNLQMGASAPDSARTDVQYTSTQIEIQAGRNVIACAIGTSQGNAGCYLLTASQTVTVEQVTNVAHVVANPVAVHPNQQVTFTASRDDAGNLIVYNWHWQPDAGQPGNATNLCGGGNPCQMNVAGSGTMLVYTNAGNPTAHVTVYTNFTLSADKTNIYRGDTVTFTPLTDGVPLKAARWRWVADSTPDSPSCASANPACKTPINASGTMWAYTATSGGDSAHVHIAVRDKYELRAAPSLIAAGAVVTFRPYLNGQPAAAARWRWAPQGAAAAWDSVAGCVNGAVERHRATFVSGTMWAYRTGSAGADSAAAVVSVSMDCSNSARVPRTRSGNVQLRNPAPTRRPFASATALTAAGCSDSVQTQGDAGTDTLPTVVLKTGVDAGATVFPASADSVYPVGTVVPFHVVPNPGFGEVIAAVDDSLTAPWQTDASGTIEMNAAHTLQAGARESMSRSGLVGAYVDTLHSLVQSSNPPDSYRRFLQWSISEASVRGAAFDSLMRVARFVAFDPMSEDSTALLQFDQSVAGYWFELDGDTIAARPPGYYSGITYARKRPPRTTLSTEVSTQPKPFVILVNGIWSSDEGVGKSERKFLTPIVRHMWFGDSVEIRHWYNPTFRTQWPSWDLKHKCAFKLVTRVVAVTAFVSPRTAFSLLADYAECLNTRIVNLNLQQDLLECATEVFNLYAGGQQTFPDPAFVDKLTADSKALHVAGIPTIFVAHSQGNLMLAAAFNRPEFNPSLTSSANVCTAALSLAPPVSATFFTSHSWLYWSGFRLNHDVLNLLHLNGDVELVQGTLSTVVDGFAAQYPALWALTPVQVFWGFQVHFLDDYLDIEADQVRGHLVGLVGTCYHSMTR